MATLFLDVLQLATDVVLAKCNEQYGPWNNVVQQPEGCPVEQHIPAVGSTRQCVQIASDREAGSR